MLARRLALGMLLSCGALAAHAQCVSIDAVDVANLQNFDTLAATGTGTVTPAGWSFAEAGTAANATYTAGTGSANTGDTYSFGAAGSSDRAFGGLLSGSLTPTIGACFVNNTGAAINALEIAYVGEEWRLGTADRADRIDFQYSTSATNLTTGTWTDVDGLDFSTPSTVGPAGARDGNNVSYRNAVIGNFSASIASGATFWIRWNDFNASGADDGLAVDDFQLIAHGSGGGGTPAVSISDTSAAEGNSGATPFMFSLSLTSPAGAGGVTVNYATADGTATAGSDYAAVTTGSATIPAGSTSVTISINVTGDTTSEANETFFVNITGATGANVGDAQGVGTILNDDFSLVPIHDIQGPGASSPFVGQVVSTGGIVTARRSNGFFLQAADAEADADPATSEGVFVFTSAAPSAAATVGNRVTVQGTVQEFVPSADPTQPPLTEIGNVTTVVQVSMSNPLPTPVALTTTFPAASGAFDQLERLEGMRVTAASLTVNAPTLGTVAEASATSTSNGVFHAVVTGVPRAYREPGVQQPDPLPAGSGASVPRWNTNPEVIAVGSAGLGGTRIDVASGCLVTGVTGPLDYTFRRYTVYPETAPTVACNGADQPKPATAPAADDVSVASFNMERFFDDVADPNVDDVVLQPAAYQKRLGKASLAIRNFLNTPDIVGAIEIENLSALQAIAARVNSDAVAAGQPNPQYVAYLEEGNDVGGIDVGFLVKTADVAAGLARVEVVSVTQIGKATTWVQPDGSSALLNDRPPLVLQARVHFADGRNYPLTAIVVHQRSLNSAEEDSPAGARVRAKRQKQAEFLANLVQQRQTADPAERLLMMGDFNAFEFNDGYGDSMGTTTGLPSPDANTVVTGDGADLVNPDLYNLTLLNTPDVSYSYAFDGNVQSLDHILANTALMNAGDLAGLTITHARIDADFPETARNDGNTPTRLSDHDPALVLLKLKKTAAADLGVAASVSPSSVLPGATATFSAVVNNAGPDAAAFAAVAFVFDHNLAPTVTAPSGWTCAPASTTPSTTTVTCTIASFASGASQTFTLAVTPDAALAGGTVTMAAAVTSQTADANSGNDNASAVLTVQQPPRADLALSIAGPATLPSSAFTAQYVYTLANNGQIAAAQPTLTITGNTVVTTSTVTAPAGWTCIKQSTGARSVQFVCNAASLAVAAHADFTLKTNVKPAPAGGVVSVQGSASSVTADANPANNQATFSTTIN